MSPQEISYPIIGMSPGNSYFKKETVVFLLEKVTKDFGRASVLIPDIPAITTYVALGYSESRARKDKAIPKGNALRNKVSAAMQENALDDDLVRIFDWASEIEPNILYQEKLASIKKLYSENNSFQEAIRSATEEVLLSSKKHIDNLEKAVSIATHYILSEFACLEFLPKYLGVEKVVYIYHKSWLVYEDYIAGKFDGVPKNHLAFLIIKKVS